MVIPQPPGKPACEGGDPTIFDQTDYQNTSIGLTICGTCPVRAWCLETVDPARGHFDGIAGGHVWLDGRIKWAIPADPIATNYLERRNVETVHHQRFEPNMIRRFVEGTAKPQELNKAERIAAARELYRKGELPLRKIAERTNVPRTTLYRLVGVEPEATSERHQTRIKHEQEIQDAIPRDRLDPGAIAEFIHRERRWYTLNLIERCRAAYQMVEAGDKAVSQAIEICHITREEYLVHEPA